MTDPFSIYINHNMNEQINSEQSKKSITNTKLIEAMQSIDAFDKTYMVNTYLQIPSFIHIILGIEYKSHQKL